jgi:hypothetical protein
LQSNADHPAQSQRSRVRNVVVSHLTFTRAVGSEAAERGSERPAFKNDAVDWTKD